MPSVTLEMLSAAMKEAVQINFLPEHTDGATYLKNWDAMAKCIQAALDTIGKNEEDLKTYIESLNAQEKK